MKTIPELVVFSSGNQYQKAASVLSTTEGCLWVAAINAALSIEIYLKSFWLLIIKLTDIRCTKKLQVAIGSIIEKRYPVKRPPRLQQAVDRALGKMQT